MRPIARLAIIPEVSKYPPSVRSVDYGPWSLNICGVALVGNSRLQLPWWRLGGEVWAWIRYQSLS